MKKTVFLISIFSLLIASILLLVVSVNATIEAGEPLLSLSETYGPEQVLSGTATFSLDTEKADTLIVGTVINHNSVSMTLKDFLDKAKATFSCEPVNCLNGYKLTVPQTKKDISFLQNGNKEGFTSIKATGSNVAITDLFFTITGSDGTITCGETPLKIDLLDDGTIDWEYKDASDWCGTFIYGSGYDSTRATEENTLSSTPYCEKITIDKTGKIMVSAEVKLNSGTANADDLIISLYENENIIKSCGLGTVDNSAFQSKSCDITGENFYIKEKKDFFVCIKNVGSAQYAIKAEGISPFTGFYGNPSSSPTYVRDYSLSVLIAGFAPFNGETKFNSSYFLGTDLKAYVQNFINSRYNKECNTNECAIPIKFIRTQADEPRQKASVSDLNFVVSSSGGPTTIRDFYNAEIKYPNITMSSQPVSLDALNLTVPKAEGSYTFQFKIGSVQEQASFEVAPVPIISSISPLTVIPGQEATFRATVSSPQGNPITNYKWDFGDGTVQDTTIPEIKHTYTGTGNFNLLIKVTDSQGLVGSRTFTITATITREGLNNTIQTKKSKLAEFIAAIASEEYKDYILTRLDTARMNSTLTDLYSQLKTATESQLLTIKTSLDALKIPVSLKDSVVFDSNKYIPNFEKVSPELVGQLNGGTYTSSLKSEYISAIMSWFDTQSVETSGGVKSVTFDDNTQQDIFTQLIMDIQLDSPQETYLVFSLPSGVDFEDIKFKENYAQEEVDSSFGIKLDDSSTIEIVIPGKYSASALEFFIAPNLNSLNVQGQQGTEKKAPWGWIIFFIIIIVLGIAAALYFIWQGKKTVKKELFRNPLDLQNIITFIKAGKGKGMNNKEIEDKLMKAGWQKSQIDFAFKKAK